MVSAAILLDFQADGTWPSKAGPPLKDYYTDSARTMTICKDSVYIVLFLATSFLSLSISLFSISHDSFRSTHSVALHDLT